MTPEQFINKWKDAILKERSAAQSHFNDLCVLLGEPDPITADPKGEWFTFEYGAKKAGGGDGWADVWKKGCFGCEYKGKGKNLQAAFKQLQLYAPALEYPPLLIVCDLDSIVIHTAFTNAVQETHVIPVAELGDPDQRRKLKWAFSEPERLRPGRTRTDVTAEAARNLNQLRENWLNPPEWVERVPEVVEGYPDRIIPKPEHEKELKKRTLTNLYNQRPAWLDKTHRKLDEAVAAAYGWEADILERLERQNARQLHQVMKSKKNHSLKPDQDVVDLARVASKNGSVKIIGNDEDGGKIVYDTKEHPWEEEDFYSDEEISREDAFSRLVDQRKNDV